MPMSIVIYGGLCIELSIMPLYLQSLDSVSNNDVSKSKSWYALRTILRRMVNTLTLYLWSTCKCNCQHFQWAGLIINRSSIFCEFKCNMSL